MQSHIEFIADQILFNLRHSIPEGSTIICVPDPYHINAMKMRISFPNGTGVDFLMEDATILPPGEQEEEFILTVVNEVKKILTLKEKCEST